ncbi:hypothetical protein VTN00DRAFT_9300 [Thermoascus crustaceus]|uniref:uncharacterized protein n=1 Tax=Thermoascus crustaceus TaxID=5088 RepID=UPI003742EAA0
MTNIFTGVGKTFKHINACSAGNFGDNGDKIPQWIKANGGTYSKEITKDVTHLITTEAAFKKNVEVVREAKLLKNIKIVSKVQKSTKTGKATTRGGSGIAKFIKRFEKGSRALMDEMGAKGYHLYTDRRTGVAYCATLVRPSLTPSQWSFSHPYPIFETPTLPHHRFIRVPIYKPYAQQLQLYELNAEPHVYATYIEYSRVGTSASDLLAPPGSTFEFAMSAFKKFFKIKTGMRWEERVNDKLPEPKKDAEGNPLPEDEGSFRYEPPMGLLASLEMKIESSMNIKDPSNKECLPSQTTGLKSTTSEQHQEDQDKDNGNETAVEEDHDDDKRDVKSVKGTDEALPGSSQ